MESALTPREIQARIRGGESLTRVAELAGVPVEQIDVYAGPVLAEREHAALLARESQVRRRGESSSQRLLGEVVADNLEAKGVSPDDIRWDAWRDEDRRWTVQASWILDGAERQAHFNFDLRGRVSAAADEQARALINEAPRATGPGGDPDSEPTIDLNDELALVRAVQADTEPPAVVPDQPSARIIKLPGELTRDEEPNDYAPAELEQCLEVAQSAACDHAFARLLPEAARTTVVQSDSSRLPLAGLAVSVKDLFDIAGEPTAAGSTALSDAASALQDCPAVARLRSAGGTVIGRTNMVEFAFSGVGVNPHFGTPAAWDGRFGSLPGVPRIPGGSSSGAAVSVATGAAFVGLGSDTGGSIRIPAALNGIVGFKNTARLVPTTGAIPLSTTLDTACAMTRSVRDAKIGRAHV